MIRVLKVKIETWNLQVAAEINEKISEMTLKYAEFESLRIGEFRKELEAANLDFLEKRKEISTLKDAMTQDRKSMATDFVAALSGSKTQAKDLVVKIEGIYQQAGQVALSGGFVEAAISEKLLYIANSQVAKWLFLGAAALLATTWGILVYLGHNDLWEILMRVPISIVFFVPGFYFSSLAGKHRKTSVALQSLGLRIKAFDAYLVGAKDSERQKLRADMVSVFFDDTKSLVEGKVKPDTFSNRVVDRLSGVIEKAIEKLPAAK